MSTVNLSRIKHHECAKCGSAILALPGKDMSCEDCGCTLFRVRWPTKDEEELFVAEYIKVEEREKAREERERASEILFVVVGFVVLAIAVAGFIAWGWDKPVVWVLLVVGLVIYGVYASVFR